MIDKEYIIDNLINTPYNPALLIIPLETILIHYGIIKDYGYLYNAMCDGVTPAGVGAIPCFIEHTIELLDNKFKEMEGRYNNEFL